MAELITDEPDGPIVELDADELAVRRAFVLDAAGVEPGGHVERLAAELGVTADELRAWRAARYERTLR